MKRAFALLFCAACTQTDTNNYIDMRIVSPTGIDPTPGFATVDITVAQAGLSPAMMTFRLDTPLAAKFGLASYEREVSARIVVRGDAGTLIGAPPSFSPLITGGLATVVVGNPSTCAQVTTAQLPRAGASAFVELDTFLIAFGSDTSDRDVQFIDLLRMQAGALAPLEQATTPLVGTVLGEGKMLLVHQGGGTIFALRGEPREERIALHPQAGPASVLVSVDLSAAIIDNESATWVFPDGRSVVHDLPAHTGTPSALMIPSATGLPAVLIYRSGRLDRLTSNGAEFVGEIDSRIEHPLLFREEDDLIVVGDTSLQRFVNCPGRCEAMPVTTIDGLVHAVSDGVSMASGTAVYAMRNGLPDKFADLQRQRSAPTVRTFESGIALVVGGGDSSLELCFPRELRPL